jgi:hypothetical protein
MHASGHEVEVTEPAMCHALTVLSSLWPRAVTVGSLFDDVSPWVDDLRLLHGCGMIDLRASEPEAHACDPRLRSAELGWGGYATTPLHQSQLAGTPPGDREEA